MKPLRFEALEPRILYSADAALLLGAAGPDAAAEVRVLPVAATPAVPATTATAAATPAQPAAAAMREIVFVDSRVADAQRIVDDLARQRGDGREIEVVTLAAGEDGVAQIGRVLAAERGLGAVHVVSHGSAGALEIGSSRLDAARLAADPDAFAAWGAALAADADLLLYGCDVASTDAGRAFVQTLAQLTGADVAASDDATGNAAQGGDWQFEFAVGRVDAVLAPSDGLQTAWQGVLVAPVIDLDANDSSGASGGNYRRTWTEGGGAVNVADSDATLTDADSATLARLTATINNRINGSAETLAANTAGTSISASFDATTGVLTLSGNDTPARYQQVLRTISYNNASNDPGSSSRLIRFVANDGSADSAVVTTTLAVNAVDDAPTDLALLAPATTNLVANGSFEMNNGAPNASTRGTTVVVNDWTALGGGGFQVWNNYNHPSEQGPPTASDGVTRLDLDVGTELNGIAQNIATTSGQSYLLSFDFSNRSPLRVSGIDVFWRGSKVATVDRETVAWQTYNFVVTGSGGSDALSFVETAATNDSKGSQLDNVRLNPVVASPTVAENAANGTAVATAWTVDADGDGSHSYTLTDTAGGRFAINAASGAITVANGSLLDRESATSHSITIRSTDSGGATRDEVFTIGVSNVNEPVVAVADAASAVEAGGIANGTAGSNPSGNLLANDTDPDAGDTKTVIGVAAGSPGSASGNVGSSVAGSYGTVVVGSNGAYSYTVNNGNAAVQALLNASTTLTDTFTYTVRDAAGLSSSARLTVTLRGANDAPALVTSAGTVAYIENGAATAVDAGLTLVDVDHATLAGASVAITANYTSGQDVLAFSAQNGITGSWNAATGVLTLSGAATVTQYQSALRSVSYFNGSDAPATATRTVSFSARDGAATGNTATRQVGVTAVNDAPVLTATGGTLAYTEGAAATAVDAGIALTDADSATLSAGTVAITANYASGQDTLAFVNQNGITGSWNAGSGVLTLSGVASTADYQAALRSVTYVNGNGNPSTLTRTVSFNASDSLATSNTAARQIAVSALNTVPYAENDAPTPIAGGLTLGGAGGATLVGASVALVGNFASGEDTLGFVDQNGIAGSWNAATGALTLAGNATRAQYEAALRSVTYVNSSDDPSTLTRSVAFAIDDGSGASAAGTTDIAVTAVNDAPVVAASGGTLVYAENDAPVAVDPGLTVADVDNGLLASASVAIAAGYASGEDVLGFVDQNGVSGSWNAATGVLTLTGSATVAQYQAALRSVTYANTSDDPATAPRSVSFSVGDGSAASAPATRGVGVGAVNDLPVGSLPATIAATEDTPLPLDGLSIADPDAGTDTLTVVLTVDRGLLAADTDGAVTVGGSGTATLTLSGTLADLNAFLAGAARPVFNAPADWNGAVQLGMVGADGRNTGSGGALSAGSLDYRLVDGTPVSFDADNVPQTGGSTGIATDFNVSVLASGLPGGADSFGVVYSGVLDVTTAGSYGFTVGADDGAKLYIDGVRVVDNFHQAAATGSVVLGAGRHTLELRYFDDVGGQYLNASYAGADTGGVATPLFAAAAVGRLIGPAAAGTIQVSAVNDAPQVAAGSGSTAYTENAAAVAIAPGLIASDVDDATLSGATVTIVDNFEIGQDVLAFAAQGGITGSWDAGSGVLTLSGSASVAQYQTALRSVTFANTSDTPGTAPRSVSFTVGDGNLSSAATSRGVVVTAVNDPPVNGVPGSQSTSEGVDLVFSAANGNAIVISDVDAAGAVNQVTLAVVHGRLTLSGTAGLSFTAGSGTADASMTFSGSAAAINAALDGLRYSPSANYNGADTLMVASRDSLLYNLQIDNALVGRYAFEDAAAPAADSSPAAAHPGTPTGSVGTVADATRGNVLSLAGGGSVQMAGLFGTPASLTLAAWVNLASADANGAEVITLGDYVVLRLDDNLHGGTNLYASMYHGGGYNRLAYGATLAGSGWHHVAFSFDDAARTGRLYLDGAEVAFAVFATSIVYVGGGQGTDSAIGVHAAGSGTAANFTGLIDEARVYRRALTDAEVDALARDAALTDTDGVTINVAPVNDAPVLAASGGNAAYSENAAPVAVDAGLTVADIDSPLLSGATVRIGANYVPGQDVLAFAARAGISGSFDAVSGVLTLSGSAIVADYETALRSVTYANTSEDPSTASRSIAFAVVDDAGTGSNTATRDVDVQAVDDAPSMIVLLPTGAANLLVNGSFESHSGADGNPTGGIGVTVAGWTAIGGEGFEVWKNYNNPTSPGPAAASDGSSRLELDVATAVNGISQAVGTVADQTYLLSFDFSHRAGIPLAGSAVEVYWRGSLVDTVAQTAVGWQTHRMTVTGSGGSDTLAFIETALTNDGGGSQLDNVRLQATAVAPAIAENAANGAAVAGVVAIDPDGADTLTYTLADSAGGRFAIDAVTGVITVSDGSALNFETATSHSVTVRATDGGGQTRDQPFAIAVGNVNEAIVAMPDSAIAVEAGGIGNAPPGSNASGNVLANDLDPDAGDTMTLVGAAVGVVPSASGYVGSLIGSYGTITGDARGNFAYTVDNSNAAVQALRDATTTLSDVFTYTVRDSGGLRSSTQLTVTIRGANDAPVVTADSSPLAIAENDAPTVVAPGLTVGDVDDAFLVSATVAITAGFGSGQDVLAFTAQNGIAGNWNAATGVLTLSGSATVAQYQAALRSVTYANTSDDPSIAARSVSFSASDGSLTGMAAVRGVAVTAVNDAPVLAASGGSAAYVENAAPLVVDAGITVSDVDNATLTGATVAISASYQVGADVLGFANQNGIAGSWNAATGVLSLSGSATVAQYQAALRSVTYANTSDDPSAATRSISFTAGDGTLNSAAVSRGVTVSVVNDAPINTVPANLFCSEDTPLALTGISISDPDAGTSLLTTTLTADRGTLAASAGGAVTVSGSGTASLTLRGTLADLNAFFAGAASRPVFNPPADFNGAVQLSMVTSDGRNAGIGGVLQAGVFDYRFVDGTPAGSEVDNIAPTGGVSGVAHDLNASALATALTGSTRSFGVVYTGIVEVTTAGSYTFNVQADASARLRVDGTLVVYSFVNASSGSVSLAAGRHAIELRYGNDNGGSNLVASYAGPDTGGVATPLLSAAGVGRLVSPTAVGTLNVAAVNDAPVAMVSGGSAAYAENAAPVVVDPGIVLADIDDTALAGARIAVAGNRASGQDVLGFSAQNGISGSYDAATGVLTLSGSATVAQYQAALRSVTYANTSETPSAATRTVSFTINDGQLDSAAATRQLSVAAADDAPAELVLLAPGAASLIVNGSFEANSGAANAATTGTGVTVTGWTAIGGDGFEVWNNFNNPVSPGPAAASDGIGRLELDVGSGLNGISQQVATVAGETYLLGFDFANRAGSAAGDSGVEVYWRGVRVMTVDTATVGWQAQRLLVTGSGGADTLAFVEALATNDGIGSQLDNVTLRAVAAAPAVAENSANGSAVADAAALDADSGIAFSYALADSAGGRFAIDAASGAITVANGTLLDFEAAASHAVTVRATDGGGSSVLRVFTIALTGVDEAPVAVADAAVAVEAGGIANGSAGSDPAGNLLANDSDPDAGDTLAVIGVAPGVAAPASVVSGGVGGGGVAGSHGTLVVAANGAFTYTVDNADAAVQALRDAGTTLTDTFSYTVRDAGGLTCSATLVVTIRGADDAPVVTPGAGTLAYTENDAPTPVAPALALADADDSLLAGATVAISTNHRPAEDVLAFTAQNGIGGSWNAATGVLTLSGSATVAQYQAALRSVSFANTSDDPDTAVRTVSFSAGDGSLTGAAAARAVAVTAVDDAPVLTTGGGTASYVENAAPVAVDLGITVSDVDSADLTGASVAITGHFVAGQDTLAFTAQNGIGGSWNAATGVLTLSGSATAAQYQAALRSVTYANGSDSPTLLARGVSFSVSDGAAASNTVQRSVAVSAVDDAPAAIVLQAAMPANLVANGSFESNNVGPNTSAHGTGVLVTGWAATGGDGFEAWTGSFNDGAAPGPAAASDGSSRLELDVVGGLNGIRQNIATVAGQSYLLSFDFASRGGTVAVDHSGVDVYWRGSRVASIDQTAVGWQTWCFVVTGSGGADTLAFVETADSNDGAGSQLDDVKLVAVDAAPVTVAENSANGTAVARATAIDPDGGGDRFVYTLVDSAGGRFAVDAATGVIRVADGGALNFEAAASHAVTVRATDGGGLFVDRVFAIGVVDVDEPVDAGADAAVAVEAGGIGNAIPGSGAAGNLLANDADPDAGDTMAVTAVAAGNVGINSGGVGSAAAGSYGAVVVAADGSFRYTVDDGNAAVQALHDAAATLIDTFTYTVIDGGGLASRATLAVTIRGADDAPVVVTTAAAALAYAENDAPAAVDAALMLADVDDAVLAGARVAIGANHAAGEDVLAFVDRDGISGITGSWDAASGVLTLTGRATVAQYQAALRSVTYANASDSPSTATRSVWFSVDDGVLTSAPAVRDVAVAAVNDAPSAIVVTPLPAGPVGALPRVAENAANGSAVAAVTAIDPDSDDRFVYTLTDSAGGRFAVDATTGVVRVADGSRLDFEVAASHDVVLRATDAGGLWFERRLTIAVTDVNEPVAALADVAFGVEAGGVADGTPGVDPRGNVLANDRDPDAGDTRTVIGVAAGSGGGAASGGVGSSVAGRYGAIVIAADGSFVYTVDNANAAVQSLRDAGDTLTDGFTYSVQDAAGLVSSARVTVTIAGTDDAPVLVANAGMTVAEGAAGNVITPAELAASDVDTAAAGLRYTLTGAPARGSLRLGGAVLAAGGSFTQADIDAGRLGYDHDSSETRADGFSFTVDDGAGGSASGSFALRVSAVNDEAPVIGAPGPQALAEDGVLTFGSAAGNAIRIADGDLGTGDVELTIVAGHGTLTLASHAGLRFTAGTDGTQGAAAFSVVGTLADLNAALDGLRFAADTDFNGAASIELVASDLGAGGDAVGGAALVGRRTVAIDVTPVDDAPQLVAASGATVAEGSAGNVIAPAVLAASDVDTAATALRYTLTAAPDHGTLRLHGAALAAGGGFTQADVDAGWLAYDHDSSETTADGFAFVVSNGNGGAGAGNAVAGRFAITVTPVNAHAPRFTGDGDPAEAAVRVAENGSAVVSVRATDADLPAATLRYRIAGGADAALFSIDAESGALRFVDVPDFEAPADADADNVYDVRVAASDGELESLRRWRVAVTDAAEAPSSADATLTTAEDTPLRLGAAGFVFSDADAGDALAALRIDAISGGGVFWLAAPATAGGGSGAADAETGKPLVAGQRLAAADLARLRFTPAADANGAGHAALTFRVEDTSGLLAGRAATLTIDVTAVDDAPRLLSAQLLLPAKAPFALTVGAGDFVASDVDSNAETLRFVISDTRFGQFESTAAAGVALADFRQADLLAGRIRFVASASSSAAGDALPSFSVAVSDGVSTGAPVAAAVRFAAAAPSAPAALPATPVVMAVVGADRDAVGSPAAAADDGSPAAAADGGSPRGGGVTPVRSASPLPAAIADAPWADAVAAARLPLGEPVADSPWAADGQAARAGRVVIGTELLRPARADDDAAAAIRVAFVPVAVDDAARAVPAGGELAALPATRAVLRASPNAVPSDAQDGALGDEPIEIGLVEQAMQATGAALTAGSVWWALRTGGLAASLLVMLPAWRHVDLLAVLPDDDDDAWDDGDEPAGADRSQDEEARDEHAVRRVFEPAASPAGSPAPRQPSR